MPQPQPPPLPQAQPQAQSQQQPQAQPQQPPDYLAKLLSDIPKEQARLKKLAVSLQADPSTAALTALNEITGTVMSIQRDQAFHTKELRDFAVGEIIRLQEAMMAVDAAYGELAGQVQSIEDEQGGSGLTNDEVVKLSMLADGTLTVIDQLLELAGPVTQELTITDELKVALAAHRQLAVECQQILAGFEPDEEEEQEGG